MGGADCQFQVDIVNEQSLLAIDQRPLRQAIASILSGEGISRATVSLAIVDDAAIRPLNARYLGHDYATDVLSFVLERDGDALDGEVIVSAETAQNAAGKFGWRAKDELLLYVIHGTLHLVGYDDVTSAALPEMRAKERHYLSHFGLEPKYQ